LDAYNKHCQDQESEACHTWGDLNYGYVSIVAENLIAFGRSPQLTDFTEKEGGYLLHKSGEVMRTLFDECLRLEQEALAKNGLKRIHSVPVHPLADDQMCIREGDGRFETAPL